MSYHFYSRTMASSYTVNIYIFFFESILEVIKKYIFNQLPTLITYLLNWQDIEYEFYDV